jgi:hypothetical protein
MASFVGVLKPSKNGSETALAFGEVASTTAKRRQNRKGKLMRAAAIRNSPHWMAKTTFEH